MSDGLTRMIIQAWSDEDSFFDNPTKPEATYKVQLNPETFDRTLSVQKLPDDSSDTDKSKNLATKAEGENYSFDLYFDGTGVVGSISTSADLKKDFDDFLDVVYHKRKVEASGDGQEKTAAGAVKPNDGNKDKKETAPVNFVRINFCGDCFMAKLDSLSIKYLLFDQKGHPLRIKASCRFSSVDQRSVTDNGKKNSSGADNDAPPLQKDTENKKCVRTEKSYEKTVSSAKKNDSVSLMCCCYSQEQMTPRNYTPANYTPVEGYGE